VPQDGLRRHDAVGHGDVRGGAGGTGWRGAQEGRRNPAGFASIVAEVPVMALLVWIGAMVANAEHGIAAIRQLVLGQQVAVGRIEVDGLMRKGDEYQGEYAQDAYRQRHPILADARRQLKASPCRRTLPSPCEPSLPSIKQKRRALVALAAFG